MKINGRNIDRYNAIVVSFVVGPPEITNAFFVSGMRRIPTSCEIKPREIKLQLFFEKEENASAFLRDIIDGCVIEDDGDRFIYQSYLNDNMPVNYTNVCDKMYMVVYTFTAIKMKKLKKYTLAKSVNSINVDSLLPSPCRYVVDVLDHIELLKIGGYVVKNLEAGNHLIIDGMAQNVVCDGLNKFKDTELNNNVFPILTSGNNTISIEPFDKVKAVVETYPIWL